MRSLRYAGGGVVSIDDVATPTIRAGQALVRIKASALCGSERGALIGGMPGNAGHEAAGVIEALTAAGSPFRVGQLVGLGAVTGCGQCDRCTAGRETQCRRGARVGGGWHAEYAVVGVRALRAVNGQDPTGAALMSGDALGVPARVARRFPPVPGAEVLVIGLGPVGLGHVVVQTFAGARVIGIEPSSERRVYATDLGATEVYAPGQYHGRPSTVIECTGLPAAVEGAFELVDSSGLVIQSGECQVPVRLIPSDLVVHREVTYTGSWFYASEDYPYMEELIDMGLPLHNLCTHEVAPEDAQAAFDDFVRGLTGKVVVRW